MTGLSENGTYRAGVAVAVLASFLTVWTTIVRDDGTGIGWFQVIMAAVVGGFAAWFKPAGMARTVLGLAIMQALLGIAIATAPSSASMTGGLFKPVCSAAYLPPCGSFPPPYSEPRRRDAVMK